MTERSENLQLFADAAFVAFDQCAQTTKARVAILQIFVALELACPEHRDRGLRLPVCGHLAAALAIETPHKSLHRLIARFKAIEPQLQWRRRTSEATASENFADGHANAMIIGPGGLEQRSDIWLGVTLMAPHVRYPDHNHTPEEVYLVLSPGKFRQGDGEWFSPGIGGSFYNVPEIKHAMRSTDVPLFAFWALRAEK
jgi:hypothetical protein